MLTKFSASSASSQRGCNLSRAHLLALLLLDTGLRFSEALGLRWENVDLESLLVKVVGKGGKHRAVPISFEGRKALIQSETSRVGSIMFLLRGTGLYRLSAILGETSLYSGNALVFRA